MKHTFTIFILTVLFLASTFTNSFSQIHWNWERHDSNPIMGSGLTGEWDDSNVSMPSVILVGDTYHMWYDANWDNPGYNNVGIGHATSADGLQWERDILNPVLLPGLEPSWDNQTVTQPTILFNNTDSLFHMWYAGWGPDLYGYIGHATSPDGGNWMKDNIVLNPGLAGEWDDLGFTYVCIILVESTYHMWYDGWKVSTDNLYGVGHATSTDGISWQKDPANPVFMPGTSQEWDYTQARMPSVFHNGDMFHMFYTGGYWFSYDIGYAYSADGSFWTKDSGNPVMTKGSAGLWDDYSIGGVSVMLSLEDSSLKMWYSGASNGASTQQIGYATVPNNFLVNIERGTRTNNPQEYSLFQNYPNPFNPTTQIEFTLPKTGFVTLIVYNMLGQEVSTLVSETLHMGSYNFEWDAAGQASGIYLYKLQAGDFIETRKMVFLK